MREVYLEGRLMTDRAAAHAEIKDKLSLPEYYGANLDALWDCLIEIGEETVITVRHPGAMFSALREYGCRGRKRKPCSTHYHWDPHRQPRGGN